MVLGKYIAQKSKHRSLYGKTVVLGLDRQNTHLQHITGLGTTDANRTGHGMYASKTECLQLGYLCIGIYLAIKSIPGFKGDNFPFVDLQVLCPDASDCDR